LGLQARLAAAGAFYHILNDKQAMAHAGDGGSRLLHVVGDGSEMKWTARSVINVRSHLTSRPHIWVFSERIAFYPTGVTVKGTGTTAYAWFLWDKDAPG
jgi:hypothetical protein